ncbi:MAG: 3'-5' exonuclease [Cyanobacteria bacterium]|nr:3'-5' exonuclease [Cyanobacteriota bacterium]
MSLTISPKPFLTPPLSFPSLRFAGESGAVALDAENLDAKPEKKTKGKDLIAYTNYRPDNTVCPLSTWHTLVKSGAQEYHRRNSDVLEQYIQRSGKYYRGVPWINYQKTVGDVPYTVLDTETTGLSVADRVIQLAVSQVREDHVVSRLTDYSTLVHPGVNVDGQPFLIKEGAINIHGISNEMVKDAPSMESILPSLRNERIGETGLVVAYNAKFDIGMPSDEERQRFNRDGGAMLNRAIDRFNRSKLRRTEGFIRPIDPALVLDPFVLIQRIHPFVTLGKKLTHHYDLLMGTSLENAHDAQADVDATVDVLKYIFKYLQKHTIPLEWAQFAEKQLPTDKAFTPEEKADLIAGIVRNNRALFEQHLPVEQKPMKMIDVLRFQHGTVLFHENAVGLPKLDITLDLFGWDGAKQWDNTDALDPQVTEAVRRERDAENRRYIENLFIKEFPSPTIAEYVQTLRMLIAPKVAEANVPRYDDDLRKEMMKALAGVVVEEALTVKLPTDDAGKAALKVKLAARLQTFAQEKLKSKLDKKETVLPAELLTTLNGERTEKLVNDSLKHVADIQKKLGNRYFYTYKPFDSKLPLISPDIAYVLKRGLAVNARKLRAYEAQRSSSEAKVAKALSVEAQQTENSQAEVSQSATTPGDAVKKAAQGILPFPDLKPGDIPPPGKKPKTAKPKK